MYKKLYKAAIYNFSSYSTQTYAFFNRKFMLSTADQIFCIKISPSMEGINRWVGGVAIVTGASAGIGASICEKFVKLGINVVAMARRLPEMEELAVKFQSEPGKLYPKKCDLRNIEEIKEVFVWVEENLGGIAILVNNAGFMGQTTLLDGDIDIWRAQMDVNVIGLCVCTNEAVGSMKRHSIDGHIIHMNSIVGHIVPGLPVPCWNVYPASKHAVTALTETLRQDMRAEGLKIKVTSISPGLVQTDFVNNFPPALQGAVKTFPALQAADIADACVYVLSTPPTVQVHELTIKPLGEGF